VLHRLATLKTHRVASCTDDGQRIHPPRKESSHNRRCRRLIGDKWRCIGPTDVMFIVAGPMQSWPGIVSDGARTFLVFNHREDERRL
jgi:hypothetical protein